VFLTQRAGQRDFVKLLDLGLAKLSESMKGAADRTRAGTVLGTPEYMSPEQARGTTIDARSDIYSLALLMHWMLLDRLPWATRDLAELLTLREQEPAALPELTSGGEHLPRSVSAIVQRCLQPSPSKRFQSCAELEQALREVDPEDGAPSFMFSESTVPVAKLAVIGAAAPKRGDNSTAPGKTPAGQGPTQRVQAPVAKPAPKPRPQAVQIPEEPRRFEFPWLAVSLLLSLGLLGYTLYRHRPTERPVLPEAPGSPYGASMLGQHRPGDPAPATPPVAPLVPPPSK
jgi:serine/threonine-protein kinase